MFSRLNKRGQSIPEYAIFIGIMVVAFITMQTYFKRGLQGFIKDAADEIAFQADSERYEANDPQRGMLLSSDAHTKIENSGTSEELTGGAARRTYDDKTQSVGTGENYSVYEQGVVRKDE